MAIDRLENEQQQAWCSEPASYPSPTSGRAAPYPSGRAPRGMQDISNDLQCQIAEMNKLLQLQEPHRDSAPRGLIARVTLRLQGNSVSNDVCCNCDCREHLAICSLCSHWVCAEHRILLGAVNLDDDGRSLGGVNVMCANAPLCDRRQYWVIEKLG